MIQRTQSLYLLAVVITCVVLFFLQLSTVKVSSAGVESVYKSYLSFASDTTTNARLDGKVFLLRTFYIALIALLSLVTIFMYRKRPVQLKLIRFSIIIGILAVISIFLTGEKDYVRKFPGATVQESYMFASFLPAIVIILLLLAHRGVKKDEELVRSADRLR